MLQIFDNLCGSSTSEISILLATINNESELFLQQINDIIKENVVHHFIIGDKKEVGLLANIVPSNTSIQRKNYQCIQEFLKSLRKEFEDRFIIDFTHNDSKDFYEEMALLCPTKIMLYNSTTNISLKCLCRILKFTETALVAEIKNMGPAFHFYHQICSHGQVQTLHESNLDISNDNESNTSLNEFDTVVIIDEDDTIESTPSIRNEWNNLIEFLIVNSKKREI